MVALGKTTAPAQKQHICKPQHIPIFHRDKRVVFLPPHHHDIGVFVRLGCTHLVDK
jgi:hypothetical protein